MKIIRVKVKTILLTVVMMFVTIPYLMYFIGEFGYRSNVYIGGNHLSTYTVGALKIYDGWPTIKFNKGRTNYIIAMSNYRYNTEVLRSYTDGSTTFMETAGNMEQALIAKSYFEEGIDIGEKSNYYKRNINSLINLEMILGNNGEAFELIEKAKSSKDDEIWAVGIANEVVYHVKNSEYDKALEICDNNKGKINVLYKYINAISYMTGDLERLNKNRENLYCLNEYGYPEVKNIMENSIIDLDTLSDINFIENIEIFKEYDEINFIENIDESNIVNKIKIDISEYENLKVGKISGNIVTNGMNIDNTKVFLIPADSGIAADDTWGNRINMNTEDIYKYQVTYANENGEFVFNNVRTDIAYRMCIFVPSIYGDKLIMEGNLNEIKVNENEEVNIDINFNPMVNIEGLEVNKEKDELVVKYTTLEGASKYGLEIAANYASMATAEITSENEIRIPLPNGAMPSYTMFQYTDKNDNQELELDPQCLLGLVNGESINVAVIAFDYSGEIISRSSFTGNELKLKKKKLNEGEKLILDGKHNEGINWIYNKLLEEPMNEEYIYPIMRVAIEGNDNEYARELIDRLEEINKTGFDRANNMGHIEYDEYEESEDL